MATSTEPTTLTLTLFQGADFERTLTWSYADAPAGPIDLSGASARLQLRTAYDAAAAAIDLSAGDGLTLGDAAGTIKIEIGADAIAALAASPTLTTPAYVWDLHVQLAGGQKAIAARGGVIVIPRVTHLT